MNIFNRVLVIVLALGLLIAAGAALLVALGLAGPEQLAPTPWFMDRLAPLAQLDPSTWRWAVGVSAALLLLGLLLLVIELRPGPPKARQMLLKQDGLGRVTVARDGVRKLVEREAGQVSGVMEARAQVEPERRGVAIHCDVAVDPTQSLPELTEELQQRVKAAVERHLGRPVAQVLVNAQIAPLDTGRAARRVR